ncbi:MAG: class I SAM-dependent methyltransferase [Saprospiraceae bacterium]|nr:class I SAM-dependent methyltransferase [Saprospiraceae bacterium]
MRFLKFYWQAQTRYNVHSPFVFAFTEAVLEDDRWYYAFSEVEALREFLLPDSHQIEVTDLGAGSELTPGKLRTIGSLVKHSASRAFICQWLFRTVKHCKPKTMLELGTSLGIGTAYQAAAALNARIITIEGCPNVATYARKNMEMLKVKNVEQRLGRFEDRLPAALHDLGQLDYVFIDGNHRKEPTLHYFEQCLANAHVGSVFVFDDIHWSVGMKEAWDTIRTHPRVTVSIDLFYIGIVFFRKENKAKEHFRLVPWLWKPWRIGFWDLFKR